MASSSSPFQINGLGSGVDTASILDTLRTYRMRPATLEQNKQTLYSAKKQAWMGLNLRLLAVQTAAQALTSASAFSAAKIASSDEAAVTATATSSAAPGTFNVNVTQLAQARKVASAGVTGIASSQTALGWSGAFTVNGKVVSVAADDSLDALTGKINALAGANAQAAVIQTAPGTWKMTIAGTQTGRQDALSLADVNGGSILSARLGILSSSGSAAAATELRYATGAANNTANSLAFASATDTLAKSGLPQQTTGTFTIGAGPAIAYDTATDTLSTLASKITAAGAGQGFSAAVVSDSASGGNKQRLQINGVNAASFSADTGALMNALGITQQAVAPGQQLFAAQDATFTLDNGLDITRPTNTVSDVLTGVTLNLKKTGAAAAPTTLTITKDTQATVDLVNNFVKAYNDLAGKIKEQSAFTPGGTTPPLLGDFTLQRMGEQLASALTATVSGQPAGFSSLRDIGVKLADTGTLSVDSGALNAALAKDSSSVARLFTSSGRTSDPAALSFLAAGNEARATSAGYDVVVTTTAAKAELVGGPLPPGGAPPAATNLFAARNAGFESTAAFADNNSSGTFDNSPIAGWRVTSPGLIANFSVRNTAVAGKQGTNYVSLQHGLSPVTLETSPASRATVTPGRTYRLDFGAANTGSVQAELQYYDASGAKIASPPSVSAANPGASFSARSVQGVAPAGAVSVGVVFTTQSGRVDLDGIAVIDVTPAPPGETLSFSGVLFGGAAATSLRVAIPTNSALSQIIAAVNANPDVSKRVQAYDANGALGLRSLDYGTSQNFSVVSDRASGPSGIGTTARAAAGRDVAGTIDGETATGKGRTLTGNQASGDANGLSVLALATAPGKLGKVIFERGAAGAIAKASAALTDIVSGTIQQELDALDARIATSQQSVTDISARVDAYIAIMQRQFTRMETQISRFKAQSAQLSQTIAGLNKNNNDN